MSKEKVAPSNLEYLIKHEVLPQGTTLEDAISHDFQAVMVFAC